MAAATKHTCIHLFWREHWSYVITAAQQLSHWVSNAMLLFPNKRKMKKRKKKVMKSKKKNSDPVPETEVTKWAYKPFPYSYMYSCCQALSEAAALGQRDLWLNQKHIS